MASLSFELSRNYIPPIFVRTVGNGWASNTINTVIFRHHGIFSANNLQIGAFYTAEGNLRLIKRDLSNDQVEFFDIVEDFNLFDAHNSISMAFDSEGYIHISYDMHSNGLSYRRSTTPWSITHWSDELLMTGKKEKFVTYPTFIMPIAKKEDTPLLFLYRYGKSGKGDACLKKYDADIQKWFDIEPCFLSGSQQRPWASNPYWNHPAIDSEGNIHLAFVWRTHSLGPKRKINNINIDYAMSQDWGITWSTSKGEEFRLPITQVNSETVLAISPGTNLINQSGSAVDSKGFKHVVFYADDENGIPQYQHLWFNGKRWQNKVISKRDSAFDLEGGGTLQIPISRPDIVIDDQDRVYVIYRGDLTDNRLAVTRLLPPNYNFEGGKQTHILWKESVEFAEPVIDHLRWGKEKILSMLVQKNFQPPHDKNIMPKFEPVYIMDWDIITSW